MFDNPVYIRPLFWTGPPGNMVCSTIFGTIRIIPDSFKPHLFSWMYLWAEHDEGEYGGYLTTDDTKQAATSSYLDRLRKAFMTKVEYGRAKRTNVTS
jgi:hypothetical protein